MHVLHANNNNNLLCVKYTDGNVIVMNVAVRFYFKRILTLAPIKMFIYFASGYSGIPSTPAETFSYFMKITTMKELLNKGDTLETETVVETFGNGIKAQEAVPAAIFSFLHKGKTSFDESVNYAISLGGDTDTIASMTGAISGAYWGVDRIPALWQNKCEAVDEAIEFANKIYKLYQQRTDTDSQ